MDGPQIDLLLQLAEHLEKGPLGHRQFHFGKFNGGPRDDRYGNDKRLSQCGTVGCALGECPFIFPQWFFDDYYSPLFEKCHSPRKSSMMFFNIDWHQADHLFFPDQQSTGTYGGIELGIWATAEQVASNIRIFCQRVPLLYNSDDV